MHKHILAAILAAVIVVLPTTMTLSVAYAQSSEPAVAAPIELPAVTQEDVLAACTAADATVDGCKAVIAAYFAYLESTGVEGAALEAVIADLVVALAKADVTVPEIKEVVVAAITEIGTTYATGDQAAAILVIAETIEEGGEVETGAIVVSGA